VPVGFPLQSLTQAYTSLALPNHVGVCLLNIILLYPHSSRRQPLSALVRQIHKEGSTRWAKTHVYIHAASVALYKTGLLFCANRLPVKMMISRSKIFVCFIYDLASLSKKLKANYTLFKFSQVWTKPMCLDNTIPRFNNPAYRKK